MSNPDGQSEPSMEEILASIRRIISEDDREQKGSAPPESGRTPDAPEGEGVPAASDDEDVLDLTEKAEEAESLNPLEEDAGEAAAASSAVDPFEQGAEEALQGETSTEPEGGSEDTVKNSPERPQAEESGMEEGLVSSATAAATVAVLSEASRDVRSQARAAEDLPIQSDKTLEGLVREAMKPLLKEWLDQNLAPLVERVVREEVRRLARRAEDD